MQTADTMTATHMIEAPDAPEYITVKQAAELLGSRSWPVVQFVGAGKLRAVRFGALTLVSAYDVEQLGGEGMTTVTIPASGARTRTPCLSARRRAASREASSRSPSVSTPRST